MPTRIAIVGASVRAAAQSAVRGGFEVVAYDLFADADLRAIASVKQAERYPHDAEEWLAQQNVDGWMYTGAWENFPELIGRMAKVRPLWGNPPEVLQQVRDPLVLQEFCRANGLLFPETILASGPAPRSKNWLHKTGRGASGSGVQRVKPFEGYPDGFFQKLVYGTSHSALYLGAKGQARLVGVTQQIVGNFGRTNEFQYNGSFAPAPQLTSALWNSMERVGQLLSAEFELTGLFGVDFVLTKEGPWVIEINPRYTASMELAERLQYPATAADHVVACREGMLPRALEYREEMQCWIKNIFFSRITHTVDETLLELLNGFNSTDDCEFVDIPMQGLTLKDGEPVCTLIAPFEVQHFMPSGPTEMLIGVDACINDLEIRKDIRNSYENRRAE